MYSDQVLDHFQNPRNAGEMADADASVQLENPACGDVLRLSLRVIGGQIVAATFLAKGCVPTIACGSMLTELIKGHPVEEERGLKREELVRSLGGLPEASLHASHLAMDALAAVLRKLAG